MIDPDLVARIAPGSTPYTTPNPAFTAVTPDMRGTKVLTIAILTDTTVTATLKYASTSGTLGTVSANQWAVFNVPYNSQDGAITVTLSANCNILALTVTAGALGANIGAATSGGGGGGGGTNSAVTGLDLATSAQKNINADLASNFNASRASNAVEGLYVNAIAGGISGTNVLPAAISTALAAQAYGLARLVSDSVLRADDGATYSVPDLIQAASALGKGIGTCDTRKVGYASSLKGRAFCGGSQSQATFTAQTSFAATTPFLLFRNNAGTKQAVLRRVILSQTGTVAGGLINIVVAVDTADRFSAGGTALGVKNPNAISGATSALTSLLVNATATAAGGGTNYIYNRIYQATVTSTLAEGNQIKIDFEDEMMEGTTGAILVYAWASTTGPTFAIETRHEEV